MNGQRGASLIEVLRLLAIVAVIPCIVAMKWQRRFSTPLVLALAALLAVLPGTAPCEASDTNDISTALPREEPAATPREEPAADRDPPLISTIPVESTPVTEPLVLRARITDATGVSRVLLFVKGEMEFEYRVIPMRLQRDQIFAAIVPPSPGRGQTVRWTVEATDDLGNGPSRAGTESAPFVARLIPQPGAATSRRWLIGALLGALVAAAVITQFAAVKRLEARDRATVKDLREQAFWYPHLAPTLSLRGTDLSDSVSDLCRHDLTHPERGTFRPTRPEVLRWLEKCRHQNVNELKERCSSLHGNSPRPETAAAPADPRAVKIAEDVFWLRVVAPLLELDPDELQAELRTVVAREHRHPTHGSSRLTRMEVLSRLRWAQTVDPTEILKKYREIQVASRPAAAREPALAHESSS